jgi:hypothetical protein
MAKELPYFKFEPNQWENGNIQMFSREDKGLFIDLCSMYWSRLGDVPLKLAIQKLCAGNATAFDSLIKEGIFTVENDFVCIDFLNEQLSDFEDTSKQNSKNAKERWEKYRKLKAESERNATALNPQYENDTIREDKIIKDNIEERKVNFANSLKPYLQLYGPNMLNDFYAYWTEHGDKDKKFRSEKQTSFSIERRLETWKRNEGKFGNNTKTDKL